VVLVRPARHVEPDLADEGLCDADVDAVDPEAMIVEDIVWMKSCPGLIASISMKMLSWPK
jgi:hypothetical protein